MINIVMDYFKRNEPIKPPPKQNQNIKTIEYTVKPGDTLFGISLAHEANMWNIKQLNGLSEDQTLMPGRILKIDVAQEEEEKQQPLVQSPVPEQKYGGSLFRSQLLNIILDIPLIYKTRNGDIEGNIKITHDTITFHPDRSKLRKTLIKNLKKKEHQITETMLNEYEFFIKQREVYKSVYQADQLVLYLWGVIGVDVPLYIDDDLVLIKVTFLLSKSTNNALSPIRELLDVSPDLKYCQPMEIVAYILFLIQYDHQTVTEDSLNITLLPFIDYGIKPIACVSFIAFYECVPLSTIRDPSLERKKEPIIPKLIPDDSYIVNSKIMRGINSSLPQYLQGKDWHFVYSPAKHGTSFEEFMRRTEKVDAHLIFIKDDGDNIFGAFVTESWRMSKSKFFGTGESFLFKVDGGELKVYPATQINQCFQMADDYGLSVGAGDRYGLWINSELLKGNTYPCETFGNDTLSTQNDFHIKYLEVWCFKDDWQSFRVLHQVKRSLINH